MSNRADNVIQLASRRPEPKTYSWECLCGSQKFRLLKGGDVECAECDKPHDECCWGKRDDSE